MFALLMAARSTSAGETVPVGYEGASIVDKPDARIPLDLSFIDDSGAKVRLGDYFKGNRPVLLAMVYFRCPRLCNLTLNGLTKAMKPMSLTPGKDFDIVTISFDPREGTELGHAKKAAYVESLGKPEAAAGWHFLTNSDPEPARELGDAIGFGFKLDAKQEQYLHQAGIYICTPDGRVSRAIAGVEFDPEVLQDSLQKASQGKSSSGLLGVALSCGLLQYDAATGKYVWAAMMLMRIVALSTLALLAAVIGTLVYRDARKTAATYPSRSA